MSLGTERPNDVAEHFVIGRQVRGPDEVVAAAGQQAITACVAEIVERRAAIERVKGMLMLVYGIDADASFELLRWQSQHHNVKLRLIAEQIGNDFALASRQPHVNRRTYDELLVTAYTRTTSPLLHDAVDT